MRAKTRAEQRREKKPKIKWVSFEVDYEVFAACRDRFVEVAGTGRRVGWPGCGEIWRYDLFTYYLAGDYKGVRKIHKVVRHKAIISASSAATAVLLKMVSGK